MRVLHITSDLDGGGVDRILLDYCSRLRDRISFDFIVTSKFTGMLEQPLIDLGFNVYHVAQVRDSYYEHCAQMKEILKNGQYDIVHDHSGFRSAYNLRIAKACGVKIRIAHSHLAFVPESKKTATIRKFITPITKHYATVLFACGDDAGKWMWGNSNFYIMKNAIDTDAFLFNPEKRTGYRELFSVSDKYVIGNIARFSNQKNHEYLVEVFREIKKIKDNAVLMLVGQGKNEELIKNLVNQYGLSNDVIFTGVRDDISDMLNMFDVFILPSRYEGLPVVLVEVQTNGIPTFVSSVVTNEINISDYIYYLDLDLDPVEWAKKIVANGNNRASNTINDSSYNINIAANTLYAKYCDLLGAAV